MGILTRYIIKHTVVGIGLVSLVVVGLDFVFSFLDEIYGLKANYKIIDALIFVIYSLPGHFNYYMPFTVLLGCLLGLGIMADHHELTVMRAAGVSTIRISMIVILPVFVCLIFNLLLAEYVAPKLQQIAGTQKDILRNQVEILNSQQGFWHREGSQFIHFNAADPNGVLYGVVSYEFDQDFLLTKIVYAKNADYDYSESRWHLHNIKEVTFSNLSNHLENHEEKIWDVSLTPTILKTIILRPQSQSISDLYYFSYYFAQQGLSSNSYRVAFWEKIFQPFSMVALSLISLSFIFGPLRSVTMGFRIFCGSVAGLLFNRVQNILESISLVYGFSPLWAAAIPIIICAAVGFYLLKKTR